MSDRLMEDLRLVNDIDGDEGRLETFNRSVVRAMLDVIDAAEQVNELHVRDALARFREVAS